MARHRFFEVPALLGSGLLVSACAGGGSGAAPPPAAQAAMNAATLLPAVAASLKALEPDVDAIPAERKAQLDRVVAFVRSKRAAGETARLLFICTHNSRRSHLGQLWATAAAAYYGIAHVETFSGGLEVTAFNPRAIAAVERAGFQVVSPGGDNPHVKVTYAADRAPIEAFSRSTAIPSTRRTTSRPS